MNNRQIVNIINFIRGVEPRDPELDLLEPVENQVKLANIYNLPATWLLQYDSLLDSRFVNLLKGLDSHHDIGAWFEVPQPLVEHAGLKWRGMPGFAWDWHAEVGFTIGYTPQEREKLADVFMNEFKKVFGKYPACVGSWMIDAHTLGYLADKYGVAASCNCRDQYGTDGYTMWGGYYNQAYYPSRSNMFMPAQNISEQIPIPVFRMLGSDPIYQYSANLGGNGQAVVTLEPVYTESGGGVPDWVKWFFSVNYGTPCLSFAYTQVGQENSFGWKKMKNGLTFQFSHLAELSAAGKIEIETLKDSAEWFRSKYCLTPPSAITALNDWQCKGRKSIWYDSRFYRTNLYWDGQHFAIRDIHLFNEKYAERYLNDVCTTHDSVYDTLPICDGFVWSDKNCEAGIRIVSDDSKQPISGSSPEVHEDGDNLIVKWQEENLGNVEIICGPSHLEIKFNPNLHLEMTWAKNINIPITNIMKDKLLYIHNGFKYALKLKAGEFKQIENCSGITILPSDGKIVLLFE